VKRLGIFVFYDKEGILDKYVEYMLNSLKEVVHVLFIVINGKINDDGLKRMEAISKEIICRDNLGFDAGGYGDVLICHIGKEKLREYDELVLCNDTCYGPFISFSAIWKTMENKTCDFWGLNCIQNGLTDHMQAYFLVFRKTLLESDFIYCFFEQNIFGQNLDLREVIAIYEKGLYKRLIQNGFKPAWYIEVNNLNVYQCSSQLIEKYHFPMMKRKCFDRRYNDAYAGVVDSLHWISDNTEYTVEMILENAERLYGFDNTRDCDSGQEETAVYGSQFAINAGQLEEFINKEQNIYIYGAGNYAKEIYHLYVKDSGKLKGFVVSDDQKSEATLYGYPVIKISDLGAEEPLIVALSKKNTEQVRMHMRQKNVIYLFA